MSLPEAAILEALAWADDYADRYPGAYAHSQVLAAAYRAAIAERDSANCCACGKLSVHGNCGECLNTEVNRLLSRAESAEAALAEAKYSPLSTTSKGRMTWTEAVAESVKQTTDALRERDEARAEVERLKADREVRDNDTLRKQGLVIARLTSLLTAKDEALKKIADHEPDYESAIDMACEALALTPAKPKEDDR